MDETTLSGMPVDTVAERILHAVIFSEDDVLLAPLAHRVAVVLRAVAPGIFFWLMALRAQKQRKEYVKSS